MAAGVGQTSGWFACLINPVSGVVARFSQMVACFSHTGNGARRLDKGLGGLAEGTQRVADRNTGLATASSRPAGENRHLKRAVSGVGREFNRLIDVRSGAAAGRHPMAGGADSVVEGASVIAQLRSCRRPPVITPTHKLLVVILGELMQKASRLLQIK